MTDRRRFWLLLAALALCIAYTASYAAVEVIVEAAPKPKAKAKRPERPPSEPPADWVFPVGELKTYKPTAADVLTRPAGVEGEFDVAKTPPVMDFGILPGQWRQAKLWSNWGDSIYGADGMFYCSIGDHAGPRGHAYVYKVDPDKKTMEMVVDYTKVVGVSIDQYAPGKIHGPLMDAGDGWLYFIGYRGGGFTTDEHDYAGDWMLRYHLADGKIENLGIPVPYCGVPSSVIHEPTRMLIGLTAFGQNDPVGRNRLFAYDLKAGKLIFDGGPSPNVPRSVLAAPDGRVYYSYSPEPSAEPQPEGQEPKQAKAKPKRRGKKGREPEEGFLARYDPKANKVTATKVKVPGNGQMRAASRTGADGVAYAISQDGVVFAFDTNTETIKTIDKAFVKGPLYTAVCRLDPTDRYLYYIPSAHGSSANHGTAVIQLNVKTGRRKVLAFLNDYIRKQQSYNLGGTFGIALSRDGGQLFMCWNGGPLSARKNDFGLCSAMILHIPEGER